MTSAKPHSAWTRRGIVPLALGAALLAAGLGAAAPVLAADAVQALREFSRDAQSGRAKFTQTVSSPDGKRTRTSSGSFEFARPDRFRFAYAKPTEQLIVADGQKVWLYDPDLSQVVVRAMGQALGATPAAILAGGQLDREFRLEAAPSRGGLDWARAVPLKPAGEGAPALKEMQVGFRDGKLAALEIVDAFGQRSLLDFSEVELNVKPGDGAFRFVAPKGTEVVQQ